MTIEGPDGKRYLVYRDGSPVLRTGEPIRLDDLDPNSAAIVRALIDAKRAADARKAAAETPELEQSR